MAATSGGGTGAVGPAGPSAGITYNPASFVDAATTFGADPTGVADSTAAIQAAVDSLMSVGCLAGGNNAYPGGTVWLKAGSYKLTKPIYIDGEGVSIRGERRDLTNLKPQTGDPAIILGHRRNVQWSRAVRSNEAMTGTATATNGSTAVVGVGTLFTTEFAGYYAPFTRLISFNGGANWYTVASVADATHLALTANFAQTTVAGAAVNRGFDYLATIPSRFAADHWFDLWNGASDGVSTAAPPAGFPKLDSSMVPSAGVRFGLRPRSPSSGSPFSDHWVDCQYAPPAVGKGDFFETMDQITIDFAIEGNNGGPIGYTELFGLGQETKPAPFWLSATNYGAGRGSSYRFSFFTKEGVRDSFNSPRSFYWGDPSAGSGVQRFTIQINLTKNRDGTTDASAPCDIRVWQNGVEQTTIHGGLSYGTERLVATGTEPSFTAADKLHFGSSEPGRGFSFWSGTSNILYWNDQNQDPISRRGSYSLYGFHISEIARYTTTAGVQARIDAGTLNDNYRYRGVGEAANHTVTYLDADSGQLAAVWGGGIDARKVPFRGYQGVGVYRGTFYFDMELEAPYSGITINHQVSDLRIVGGTVGVLIGFCLNPTIERVDIVGTGTYVGIANDSFSTYDIVIRDCSIGNCLAAWIHGWGGLYHITNLSRNGVGKYALRFHSCAVHCSNLLLGGNTGTESDIKITNDGLYGFQYWFDTIDSDNEGDGFPLDSIISCEADPMFTELHIKEVNASANFSHTPFLHLKDNRADATANPARVYVHDLFNQDSTHRLGIMTDGPAWQGVIDDVVTSVRGDTVWRVHNGTDGLSNVIARHRADTLPMGGMWQRNAHEWEIRHPAAASPRKYLCSTSGVGPWSAVPIYQARDVVYDGRGNIVWSGGTIYQCILTHLNQAPPNATYWRPAAAWDVSVLYLYGNLVTYGGGLYQSVGPKPVAFYTDPLDAPPNTNIGRTPAIPTTHAQADPYWLYLGPATAAAWAPIESLGTPTAGP